MGHLMEGFTRNARGGVSNRRFDSDQFPGPSEGWYDAPDKVPPMPGQKSEPAQAPAKVSQSEGTISANLGTTGPQPLTNAAPKPVEGQGRRSDGKFTKGRRK